MASYNMDSTDKCKMLWLNLTIYGSKLESYTLLEKYCSIRTHSNIAPEIFENHHTDVIILEYDYPVKESLEILSEIKTKYSSIPIIILTEQHSEELAVWAFRARVWDYFVKPLQQDKLLSCIETILQIKNKATHQRSRTVTPPPNIKPMDTRFKHVNQEYLAIAPAISFLESNYQKKVSETTLANLCGMNPFRFSRCFKKEIGITLQEYIVRLRIKEALRLLDNPNASITDVAILVGFNDTSYFSRTFKKYMEYSPSEFRSMQKDHVGTLLSTPSCIENESSSEDDWILLQKNIESMNKLGQASNRKLNS